MRCVLLRLTAKHRVRPVAQCRQSYAACRRRKSEAMRDDVACLFCEDRCDPRQRGRRWTPWLFVQQERRERREREKSEREERDRDKERENNGRSSAQYAGWRRSAREPPQNESGERNRKMRQRIQSYNGFRMPAYTKFESIDNSCMWYLRLGFCMTSKLFAFLPFVSCFPFFPAFLPLLPSLFSLLKRSPPATSQPFRLSCF